MPVRRIGRWGYEGVGFPPPGPLVTWLEGGLGAPESGLVDRASPPAAGSRLEGAVSGASFDPADRLAHALGQSLPDLLRYRLGAVERLPDAVVRPESGEEVAAILESVRRHGYRVVPWGGGTSVTGGVNVPHSDEPVVTMDLERLSGLVEFDEVSGLARFGAGTTGPAVEAALNSRGWTLGHFPQSFELSTVGGWVVTHSSGQESLGYGRIEGMVAGLEVATPAGDVSVPALPASAAGPDMRQWILGSEGRFGVVTDVTLRVRRLPEATEVRAALFPDWEHGVEACRAVLRREIPLALLRLSDEPETEIAVTVGLGDGLLAPAVRVWLRLRGIRRPGCLFLVGAKGTREEIERSFDRLRAAAAPFGCVWLGAGPGRKWKRDRFRHPYLRDGLLDRGYATETLETAAPWSTLPALYREVRAALRGGVAPGEREIPVLCHLSHPYRDGASLYFTFFYRCGSDPEAAIARWADLKRRASAAIARCGGATSHHHGIGRWHAPWLEDEIGPLGRESLAAVAKTLDPTGILNPGVLLDPVDRLAG